MSRGKSAPYRLCAAKPRRTNSARLIARGLPRSFWVVISRGMLFGVTLPADLSPCRDGKLTRWEEESSRALPGVGEARFARVLRRLYHEWSPPGGGGGSRRRPPFHSRRQGRAPAGRGSQEGAGPLLGRRRHSASGVLNDYANRRRISLAAVRPAPIARMTVAAPVTMSPPANTLGMEVSPFSSAST